VSTPSPDTASPDMSPDSPSYDTQPTIALPAGEAILRADAIWAHAAQTAADRAGTATPVIVVDVYPGADLAALRRDIAAVLPQWELVDVEDAALPADRLEALLAPTLTDDRVFGILSHATLDALYDTAALSGVREGVVAAERPTVVLGWGAALAAPLERSCVVLVDMARWELQQRQRAGATNWHCDNAADDALRKYKRGFFVEWRVADRHKRALFALVDLVVDGNAVSPSDDRPRPAPYGALTGDGFRGALRDATARPFRVVPFFDPGVWGGQWMKRVIGLDPSPANYAWCFDCVPEENSVLVEEAGTGGVVELPALDLVLAEPAALLGERTYARFGAEFPIRFDFLDTMGGGNLSLQVHPLTDYIQDVFGMPYTQDESYYLLDAGEDAVVYLGLREGIDRDRMLDELRAAQDGGPAFCAEDYVNVFPARKHDHFAIPAGTVHASGADSMVLEISATPFIFTFKLWDWGRLGLDGIPRPVHLDHGARNIQWDRDTTWVRENLVDQVQLILRDDDVVEERTGLHELEFIEVRRHWFSGPVAHHTEGTVRVLNLVEGDEVRVTSPSGAFDDFVVHYAETFIVPAAVGAYVVEPTATSRSDRFATVTASVRGTSRTDALPDAG